MNISHFLEPSEQKWMNYPGIPLDEALGKQILYFDGSEKWFEDNTIDIALVGVPEVRNSIHELNENAPIYVRQWLYGMRQVSTSLKIADLGNLRGNGLHDRYLALREVVNFLYARNVSVLIIGGSQDLTLPACDFMKNRNEEGNIVIVDPFLDVDPEGADFSSSAFIHKLIDDLQNKINELSVLGIQLYYCSKEQENYLANRFYPVLRLKDLRGEKIDRFEVFLRDASMLSVDLGVVRGQPALPLGVKMPNGFSEAEACRIFWYAGASDNLKVTGLFNVCAGEERKCSAVVAAQMLWHYLEGAGLREGDYPLKSIEDYELKVVFVEKFDETVKFYHNPQNGRWWIQVPSRKHNKIVACHIEDYQQALNNELPDIWWRYFIRTTGNFNVIHH